MNISTQDLDFSEAVDYHYDRFPPDNIDANRLMRPLSRASAALARYDQMLKAMHNSAILLGPLRSQEAVISSRMEGTITTLDEVLRYQAEEDSISEITRERQETFEVILYTRALHIAQESMEDGAPISSHLIRTIHEVLLSFGRGASMAPGEFKTDQNYLADRSKRKIHFIPIRPENLNDGMEKLLSFMANEEYEILVRTALTHLEFESLHPFKDGNGRIGRMLITLMLWHYGVISAPHFYISNYFEERRDEYIDRMRDVSKSDTWTDWIIFFLEALEAQAQENLKTAEEIRDLYETMKIRFREILTSQWHTSALDFLFSNPIFRNNTLPEKSGIPAHTANRFTRALLEEDLLITLSPPAGRRPGLYAFEPLLQIVRS